MQGELIPVVLYGRISEVRDDRSASVDDQLAWLRKWAQRENWPIVGEYRDDNISASRFAEGKERPGWDRALEAIRSGQARALLVWEFSRGTRDVEVYGELLKVCRTHRARLGYNGRLYDPNSAADAFAMGLEALSAARHSDETSERVRRAVLSRAERGLPHAGLPYGYRRILDPKTGRVMGHEVHPEEGPVVQEIVRRLLAGGPGNSAHAIARDLNERGVPTAATGRCAKDCPCRKANGRSDPQREGEHSRVSGQWLGTNIGKLVLRKSYAGIREHGGEEVEGVSTSWPPLISMSDRNRLKAMFADEERAKYRNPTHVKHLGTGLFRCGREGCDGRMRVVAYPQGAAYSCRKCHKVSRRQAQVDDWVTRVMVARLSEPDFLDALMGPDAAGERAAAVEEVARLEAEMADARKLLKERRLSLADFTAFRAGWEPLMAEAEAAAVPPVVDDAMVALVGPDAAARWEEASIGLRRATVARVATVTILPTGRTKGGTPPPFDHRLVVVDFGLGEP